MSPPSGKDATSRSYLSIREVLDLLVEEFPDVTVSKIRFLESRGLIHPERTPSGYRKFYDQDVERLRWILRQQREHFLPLKVIKGRLEQDGGAQLESGAQSLFDDDAAFEGQALVTSSLAPAAVRVNGSDSPGSRARGGQRPHLQRGAELSSLTKEHGRSEPQAVDVRAPGHEEPRSDEPPPGGGDNSIIANESGQANPPEVTSDRTGPSKDGRARGDFGVGAHFSVDELGAAAGSDARAVQELEDYGLINGREIGGVRCYDEQALVIAKLAAGFSRFGIEARHLKSFRYAAEREAGLFAQVVNPLLRQRNPAARERAMAELTELTELACRLSKRFLEAQLDELTGG